MSHLARFALVSLLIGAVAQAQNGSNYMVLANGVDAYFSGLGAGGSQMLSDGIMTWVSGEDLKGSHRTSLHDFGFRMTGYTESVCVVNAGPSGPALRFPGIFFIEMDGLNGNAPPIFTNPACSQPSFPLGASGAVPYGLAAGTTANFFVQTYPSSLWSYFPSSYPLLPNHGIKGHPYPHGSDTLIGLATVSLPIASTGFCWNVKLSWSPSALPLRDDIDGLVHFLANSPDANQYWGMSDDEQNLWQSQSVATTSGETALVMFPANMDYQFALLSAEPVTVATLAPRAGSTIYSAWTANVSNEYGVVSNPNGGFDVGRGSSMLSFSGHAGVANPNTGVGNQDPSLGPGAAPTLGFATWDNGGDLDGSVRLTWVSIDLIAVSPLPAKPETDPGVLKAGGRLRLPVVSANLLQTTTTVAFPLLGHVTRAGFVDPLSPSGSGPGVIGGASNQVPLPPSPLPCIGIAINLTYGTTGRKGTLGAPGALTFNPAIADVSGSRQLFVFE